MQRLAFLSLLFAAACGNQLNIGTTHELGYMATDSCSAHGDVKSCVTAGCNWLELDCPAGKPCPPGVCYAPDPCLGIDDAATCKAKPSCAWSEIDKLCPAGANCPGGGYCHGINDGGDGCACVTPVGCDAGGKCPPPECDCSGGGTGGGTCTCACPACAPGEACPPCKCDCGPGGGPSGCVDDGTCACACPACEPGKDCPPCTCQCGPGGVVTVPDPTTGTGGGNTSSSPDLCSKYVDEKSCFAHTTNKCTWYAFGKPCASGDPSCISGVCQGPDASGGGGGGSGSGGGCACGCPGCDPSTQNCPPCACDCKPNEGGGCVPPPPPGPGPTPTPCPAIGCAPQCPNGVAKDANGCETCTCL